MSLSPSSILMLLVLGIGSLTASDSSSLAGNSFIIYHQTIDGGVHRCSLKFGQSGASSDIFPNGSIPATGTIKTKRQGRGGATISEFTATGEAPWGKGSVSFTATKDGNGAKGSVILTTPGKAPVTITFSGVDPQKK